MPADIMEKNSSSPVAATPASVNTTPDKPKTASEHRKSSKPIMEKRRRARINESLSQLKTLILDALKKDSSRHSKLEKADILEMTVKHLRNLQRAQMTGESGSPRPPLRASLSPRGDFFQTSARGCERHSATFYCLGSLLRSHGLGLIYSHNSKLLLFRKGRERAALSTDPSVLGKYRAGFSECMNEVTRFLSTCEGVNTEVRTRLLGHLANCMTQINAMTYPGQPHPALQAPPPPPPGPGGPQHAPFAPPPPLVPIPGGAAPPPGGAPCKLGSPAGEAAKVFGGFQVVPAPDGQFAFLIPNGAFAHSGPVIPVYTSNSGTSVGPNAVSPSSGPSLTADSMWRPWRN
uniref:Hes family bHLH transcription factor 1 n=2 Tax=Boreoeutheria TaxID=1437010 RepID=A0AAF6YGT8_BOVIN